LYLNKYKPDPEKENLKSFLIKHIPNSTALYTKKEHFKLQKKIIVQSAIAVNKGTWLSYNDSWLNMLIFDLDYKINLDDAIKLCMQKAFEPTWICETDKGIHIAFALENMVRYDWTKTINSARFVKRELTKIFKADTLGSHRLKGIWRNPTTHNFYFSGLTYCITDFLELLSETNDIKQDYTPNLHKPSYIDLKNFKYILGNRNNYIWYLGMAYTKIADYTKILNYIKTLQYKNKTLQLDMAEIEQIARSVFNYNKKNLNFVSLYKQKEKENVGAMGFKPIVAASGKAYSKEIKRRQSLSAKRTNQLDKTEAKQKRASELRASIQAQNIQKVKNFIELHSDTAPHTIAKISCATDLHRHTVSKILKALKFPI